MSRTTLNDAEWASLHPILLEIRGIWKHEEQRLRCFVEAVATVLRTGIPWADLPSRFGPGGPVRDRYRRWAVLGVWEKLWAAHAPPTAETVLIDATILKTHRSACGARGKNHEDIGAGRGGISTKIHAAVDTDGIILRLIPSPGQRNDCLFGIALVDGVATSRVVADRGYDMKSMRDWLAGHGIEASIPTRKTAKVQISVDPAIYAGRHVVENVFSRLKDFARLALRRDKTSRSFMGFAHFAAALLNIRLKCRLCG